MADIGADLLEAVRKRFTRLLGSDKMATELIERIRSGKTGFAEAENYAYRVGKLLAKALGEGITAEALPDGVLTEEIAGAILRPMLYQDYKLVTDAAAETMNALNRRAGIGLKTVLPKMETDRVEGLIQKAASYESYEKAAWVMQEPVVNFSQHVCDRLIEENTEAHFKAGFSPKITRKAVGGCCEWCSSLAGKYDYPAPREVYRRHENCRCLVLYDPGDGKVQNAHTKKVYDDAKGAEREHRIELAERQSGAKRTAEQKRERREIHAERYYEEVRNRTPYSDAKKISKNIGEFDVEQVEEIRQHMFIREQPRDGGLKRFDPDYEQAEAWQRLIDGKKIWDSDIVMLQHEYMELTIMKSTGCSYEEAHAQTNQVYNWFKEFLAEKERKGIQ